MRLNSAPDVSLTTIIDAVVSNTEGKMRKKQTATVVSSGLTIAMLLPIPASLAEVASVQSTPATQSGTTTSTTAGVTTTPNSANNYKDDRFQWHYAVEARSKLTGPNDICIPANTRVIGAKGGLDTATTTTVQTNGGSQSSAQASQWQQVYLDIDKPILGILGSPTNVTGEPGKRTAGPPADSAISCPTVATPAHGLGEGDLVYVSADDVAKAARAGWDYGVLVAPFKLQLSGDKEFTGSVSIGPYLGYQFPLWDFGLTLNIVGFAGASSINVNSTDASGQSTSQTLAGLSYGGGLVTTVKESSFQVGVLVGVDHVNSSANYKYNNEPWLSFEIGYSFMQ
ncbi:MAG TPA: hypothetical protein VLC74_07350 [Rhizomicrobium sp.]|nr:hypothetical protein [Rhizomicrobium sp.]